MNTFPLKETITDIKDKKVVQDWLDGLTEGTIRNYLKSLAEFSIVTEKTPQEMLNIAFQEKKDRTPPWESQVNEWFRVYAEHCKKMNRSRATRDIRTTVIKGFFHYYELDTPKAMNKRRKTDTLKIKNKRPALTKEKIKKALDASRTLRIKAVMLTQASSGLSVIDVINLKIKDFYNGLITITEDGKEICKLHLNREKTGKEFTTFLSYEAVDSIKNYIKNERGYKDNPILFQKHQITKKGNGPELTEELIEREYRALNRWMKNDPIEKGRYREITSHMLRKFFSTQFTNSKMSYEPRKHMMGHIIPGVDDSYYLEHQDELQELYIEYMDKITINPTKTLTIESPEYREIRKQLDQNETESKDKDEKIATLERKIEEMDDRNKVMDEKLNRILSNKTVVEELNKM